MKRKSCLPCPVFRKVNYRKKFFPGRLILICYILLISCVPENGLQAQHHTDHQYISTDSIFNNPERGFYKYTSRGSASGSISKSTLDNYYNNGFTLIYRIYYMPDYVDQPISADYLDKIREDFQIIRESGIKVVLRFAYTSNSTAPYGDASPEQVQEHIAQLKPLLQENADVIAVLQAGFIGAWGEWYYTDYFATGSPDNVTAEDLQERSDLVYSLLDALPVTRQIQLRYVGYKMDFFGEDPITPNEAYSGNAKSRIAHHNDCFLSGSNDVGTYHSAYDRVYLKTDSKYTSVGGETCRWYEPRSNCDTALVEMARYHWSFINIDYFGTTIQNWKDNGCFDDIQRKLGYRYELVSSSLQDSSRQGAKVHGSVQLINAGFSNPYNPRSVEIVIRNHTTKKEYFLPLKRDIRKNPLGEILELEFEGGVPSEAENGTYDVFLNLPDPMISLRDNPKYSVRLANENTWESATGYNRLFHTLVIHPASSAGDYVGTDYFVNQDQHSKPIFYDVSVDGSDNDWQNLPTAFLAPGNQHVSSLKIYNDNLFLYFMVKGPALYPNYRLLLDVDNDPNTGMNFLNWQSTGMDYLAENSNLYRYIGEDGSTGWLWQYMNPLIASANDSVMEIAIPLHLLDNLSDTIRYGYQNGNSGYKLSEYIPSESGSLLFYIMNGLIDHPPGIFSSGYANNAILYWGIRENDQKFRVIERSSGNQNNYNMIAILSPDVVALTDPNLTAGESYYYRSFLTDFQTVTLNTSPVSLTLYPEVFKYSELTPDGDPGDWRAIKPIMTLYEKSTYLLKTFADTRNLNFLITGDQISGFELYLETDDDPETGTTMPYWSTEGLDYKITGDSLFYFQKAWEYAGKLSSYVFSDSVIEIAVPFNDISLGTQATIKPGLILYCGSETSFLPFQGKSMPAYNRVLPLGPPAGFHLISSQTDPTSKIIIRWDNCANCDGYIIEKLTGTPGSFVTLAELDSKTYQYIDDNLENHTSYSYRMYSYNAAGRSDYTFTASGSTHDVGISDNNADDRFQIFTDPSTQRLVIRINDPDISIAATSLFDVSGRQVYSSRNYKGEQELSIPLQGLLPGIYLLSLNYRDGHYSRTFLIY